MRLRKMLLSAAALAAVASFALAGCGGEAENVGSSADPVVSEAENAGSSTEPVVSEMEDNAIVGTWEMTQNTIGDEEIDISDMQSVYVFNSNGSFEMILNGDTIDAGAYSVSNGVVVILGNGEEAQLKLEDGKMIAETETAEGLSVAVYQPAQN